MRVLKALRLLIFGETWTVPLGVFVTIATAAVAQQVASDWWQPVGGFVLLVGALGTVVCSAVPAPGRG